ncbi:ribosome small subunit-dependent GTPase A [Roseibium algae]|uniref:Small ribosomal subunit biogenesis GTPase RsgA n=1 Tax=Roseibium algae TaxID=3123038 RepID=A0ABU8TPM1_9HYPH
MYHSINHSTLSLVDLGWSEFFDDQIGSDETGLVPVRVATVHRSRMTAQSVAGPVKLRLPPKTNTAYFAVGDWVLTEPRTHLLVRLLERHTLLQRQTEGARTSQLIAANVDTLFIVTSCNEDFNHARLERYLVLANEAGTTPVVVLTKADQTADVSPFLQKAAELQRDLDVVAVNAKSDEAMTALAPWCGAGQTVALVGSSGVGKSTLLNTLAAKSSETAQPTGGIRKGDDKGRHTTTSRSLHPIIGGGWVIDTPGMRTLHVGDVGIGLDILFSEIMELAPQCRFRDCSHTQEPGCAVQAAVAAGTLDPERLARWRKLAEENRGNSVTESGPRGNKTPEFRGKRR